MLLVDDRENPKVVNKLLMRMGKDEIKVCRMKASDYTVGEWGIEAKEINDLYRSIMGFGRTRTIVEQLRDLQEAFDDPFLVVYGTQLKPYIPGGRPNAKQVAMEMARMKKVIKQFKATFYQRFPKIKYMEVATMDEFVEWLVVSHTQQGFAEYRHKQSEKNAIKKSELDSKVRFLSEIEGITVKEAEGLLEKFGSIPNILKKKTTQKSLMQIKGITRRKARAILDLREDYTGENLLEEESV